MVFRMVLSMFLCSKTFVCRIWNLSRKLVELGILDKRLLTLRIRRHFAVRWILC